MKAKSAYINEMSGSLKANPHQHKLTARMTLNKAISMGLCPSPTDAKTEAQLTHRALYREACDYWQNHKAEMITLFEEEAKEKRITVFNTFISHYLQPKTVTLSPLKDTYIDQAHPDNNYGNLEYIYIKSNLLKNQRMLTQFDLTLIPSPVKIMSAKLHITIQNINIPQILPRQYNLHRNINAWNEYTTNWNNAPAFNTSPTNTQTLDHTPQQLTYTITETIQKMKNGEYPPNGWTIKDLTENNPFLIRTIQTSRQSSQSDSILEITYI